VYRILGDTPNQQVGRRVFTIIAELTTVIHQYVAGHDENPIPFTCMT
jgi:hypothetical protein